MSSSSFPIPISILIPHFFLLQRLGNSTSTSHWEDSGRFQEISDSEDIVDPSDIDMLDLSDGASSNYEAMDVDDYETTQSQEPMVID